MKIGKVTIFLRWTKKAGITPLYFTKLEGVEGWQAGFNSELFGSMCIRKERLDGFAEDFEMIDEELIDCHKCGYTHREGYNCAAVSASSLNDDELSTADCWSCNKQIYRDDDDASICIDCGGRNRRVSEGRE